MFTLQHLLSLPVFLSTTLIAHALAAGTGFIDSESNTLKTNFAAQLTGGEKCDDDKFQQIRDGFNEMTVLFRNAARVDWNGQAELEYFGRQDRIGNYTSMIEENLIRAAQYANLKGNATRNPDIHVRCDDPNNVCNEGNKKEGKHVAYNIGNEPHINFCKRYFNLDPLDTKVEKAAAKGDTSKDIMQYYNRATVWARQVMHISAVGTAVTEKVVPNSYSDSTGGWATSVSNGAMNTSILAGVRNGKLNTVGPNDIQTFKYAYGATRAKLVAMLSFQMPYDAANNAENYALYAQARYVIQKKNFYPNVPIMQFGDDMAVLANEQLQDGGEKKYACYDDPDVLPRKTDTNSIGAPLQTSSATSSMFGIRPKWTGQALYATLALCLLLSILA
ncbi:hypothetical protein K504DRAFT_400647 [Pleomassaria siparia CBS 279.74]|uniref:Uncharacterized protein n=1 Tax=Pleomassaria siparia CBS 279.74 TaxID=1314801 RepID=A0A6G1KI95_9PLEO|nr:hypothetical protein K504DRAFT_400647 [Pleomassaria siparia CBS 279.74]